jgi:hypothetical protein
MQLVNQIRYFRDVDGFDAWDYVLANACHQAIDYWSIFKTLPYNLACESILQDQSFALVITLTKFVGYLVTWHHLFDSQVYSDFWKTLRLLFEQPCSSKHMACRASVVGEALN